MIHLRVFGTVAVETDAAEGAESLHTQPKALALLTYLVIARPRGFHQRDRLVGLLWPEMDQEHARAALRKTVHRIRQALGESTLVSRGAESLGVSPHSVRCDAIEFDEAIAEGGLREALDLYSGELLPALYASGAGPFEEWLELERAYYRERAVAVAWKLVERFAADKELTNASQLARLVARLASTDERMLRRVLTMLARLGDRAGAIDVYTRFADRLWKEYETRPSLETQRLVDEIHKNAPV